MSEAATEILRVWGIGTPRTLRVHWTLEELGLPYETRPILTRTDAMKDPAFRALSGRGKVPLLELGDQTIGESAAISLTLADRYRSAVALTPAQGSPERPAHDDLCFFAMTEMDALLYVLRRHEGLPDVYGESEIACTAARTYFLRSAGEIERRLADGRAHLLGDAFTIADLLVKSCLDWAGFCGIELPGTLRDYAARLGERPALRAAMATNFPPHALAALSRPSNP